ncbi:MAG: tRNA (cytidine(34)-2'-O)-methyltransferase [Roseimicrobium sp.]
MLHIVLFQPEIPHNTGAVGRLCLATGARLHLIKPLGFSIDDKQLKRAGLDYWREVDVRVWDSFEELCAAAPPSASWFLLTTKASKTYWHATFPPECYLVFGPETRGLPDSMLREREEACLRIPMKDTRSINLATAVGIVLYEALRQQNGGDTGLDGA